ncbi:MAG: CCA tRNA nucleotidyltransferase [Lachnospiraceae bacterium]|nr:CCA tRNA nucleotidyltransferase [Lachnospiraceae bacterium]
MRFVLPAKVDQIIKTLKNAGFEAYAVGGCVRDLLLKRRPNDWDITTNARPDQVKALFRRTFDTGIKHGTVTVIHKGEHFEVTTYRIDGIYEDGRHPKQVVFSTSLKEDLKRRDFTINALAYNEEDGLVDEFDGRKDLDNRIIRAVGDAGERFTEDALRILRAFRFAAQLGFSIEEKTLKAAGELAGNLKNISAERINEEFTKLICSPHPEILRDMYKAGITAVILPELDVCMEMDQKNKHHLYTVGEHTIRTLMADAKEPLQIAPQYVTEDEWREFCSSYEKIRNSFDFGKKDIQKKIRYALLFHDLGKPACMTEDENGNRHFKGHAERSERIATDILRRFRSDNETLDTVSRLVRYHDTRPDAKKNLIRRAMSRIGSDYILLFPVRVADTLSQSSYRRKEKLEYEAEVMDLYLEIVRDRECVTLSDLAVNGSDLIKAGISPGPALGEKLKELLDIVLEDPECNTKDYLLSKL